MKDQNQQSPLKILMIEDDETISSLVKEILTAQNHHVEVINNGSKAIKLLGGYKPSDFDVILLDLMLPGANGWQVLAKIRSLPDLCDVCVIMLTGIDDDSVETRAFYDGADDFLNKPCNINVLLARINNILKRKKQIKNEPENIITDTDPTLIDLSDREKEILAYVVEGLSNKEISDKAFITENTVMNHIKSIKKKLKVKTRIDIAVIAMKYGLTN